MRACALVSLCHNLLFRKPLHEWVGSEVHARVCSAAECDKKESHPREFRRCGRCGCAVLCLRAILLCVRVPTYCSQVCQRKHWKAHKPQCKAKAQTAEAEGGDHEALNGDFTASSAVADSVVDESTVPTDEKDTDRSARDVLD